MSAQCIIQTTTKHRSMAYTSIKSCCCCRTHDQSAIIMHCLLQSKYVLHPTLSLSATGSNVSVHIKPITSCTHRLYVAHKIMYTTRTYILYCKFASFSYSIPSISFSLFIFQAFTPPPHLYPSALIESLTKQLFFLHSHSLQNTFPRPSQ